MKPTSTESAVTLPLLVKPRAARQRVVGLKDGALVVQVTAPPVEGAANRAVIATIAEAFGVKPGQVEIIVGARSRRKTVRIRGVTESQVAARLQS